MKHMPINYGKTGRLQPIYKNLINPNFVYLETALKWRGRKTGVSVRQVYEGRNEAELRSLRYFSSRDYSLHHTHLINLAIQPRYYI